jgi:hypothetical protein
VPTPAARPEVLRGRVFRGSTVVESGLLTRKQLRSGVWRRLRQDVYADAAVPLTHRVQMAAVSLALPAGAGFAGLSAALLWGVPDIATADDPVEVVVPRGDRWHPGPWGRRPADGVRSAAGARRTVAVHVTDRHRRRAHPAR